MAANVTVSPNTPWTQYYCSKDKACPLPGYNCHYDKYCIPELAAGETCKDAKDTVAPFIARVDNIYTLFCDMPESIKEQTTTCPLGCEKWEDCHSNVCYLKKCTKDQTACKNGQLDQCMGVKREEIMCYEQNPHGSTHPATTQTIEEGLSSAQIGGIAGGVSAAVVALLAIGAFVLVRRRRAAKAAKAQATLPTYSAHDEKNAMQQVVSA